ncbi:MAG TPA: hypothetical protein VFW97_17300 [Acidimicrobiia bacterium]|jgi:hypothetical protein|nr:hypothetical protein [Acidimicrobiia bacterium]
MLLAAACKVDTTVTVTVHDDGSGVVTVTAVLDADAVKATESGGGKLEDRLRLGDLAQAGWTLQPWARAADGSAQITFSKPFSSPEQATAIVKELNGTVGPLHDLTVSRDPGTFSTTYSTTGTLDLKHLQTGLTADNDVVGSLVKQGVDANAVDQSLLADLRDSFDLTVKVEQPGGTTVVKGVPGKTTPVDASTSVLDTTRVILVTIAVVLVVAAVVVLLWPRRRRRRRANRRGARGATTARP